MNIIITTKEDLTEVIRTALQDFEKEKESKKDIKLYSINQVAKMLHLAHQTVKRAAENGLIHTTVDGKIPAYAVEQYLRSKT